MSVADVDFVRYHTDRIPRLIADGRGTLAGLDAARHGPMALQLGEDGPAFTYVPEEGTVRIEAGTEIARTTVVLDQEIWNGLVADLESPPGLLYSSRLGRVDGNPMRFVAWEPALRALYHGRPILELDAIELICPDGRTLDPSRRFGLDSDRAEMADFLSLAGYLVVRDMFDSDEIEAMLDGAGELAGTAREGDRKSWWAGTSEGETVVCRVIDAGRLPVFAKLHSDSRLAEVAACSEHELHPRVDAENEGVSVLWKRFGASDGLADLPWHRDCGMGGHASMCPLLIASICLTSGGPEAGELRVIPGSHHASFHFIDGNDPDAPEGIAVDVGPGDVSFHYSDIAHVSLPPTEAAGPHRISALTAFVTPTAHHHRGGAAYNDELFGEADGRVEHLADRMK